MAINKVVYGNQTLVDLTQDSVEASNLLEGETAHDRSGAPVTGTAKQGHAIQDSSGTGVTQRNTMQFKGMTVTDDANGGKTVVEATKTSVGLGNVPNVTTDNQTPTVTEASTRANLATGDTLKTIIGKIKKFFTDIKDLAFIAKDGSTSKYLRGDGTWQVPPDTDTKKVFFGTCTGQAANQKKAITISSDQNFTLTTGAIIFVKFDANNTYSATAEAPVQLNVNSSGDKTIYGVGGSAITGTNTTFFGRTNYINQYVYDGTYWVWTGSSADNNTTYTPQALGIGYGTCTTAAATAAKAATLSNYALVTNGTVAIKFTNAVPANATLAINGKTAKNIYYRGAAITAGIINAGDTATFFYNGSQYHVIAVDNVEKPTFTEASTRANIESGETFTTILGKIKKFFTDLKDLAFIAIDGASSTKYLRGDGTWQTFPTIPTVNNATLTIQKNGTTVKTFTANASSNVTCNITMSKSDVGLGNVNNTADANKSVNYANTAGSAPANGGTADQSTALNYSGIGNSQFTVAQTDTSFMGRSGWATYLLGNHGNGASDYCQALALPFWGPPMYQRREGGELRGWKEFITEENIVSKISQGIYIETVAMSFSGNYATFTKTEDVVILSIELANTDNVTYGIDFSWTRWSDWKSYRVCAMSQNALLTGSYWVDVIYIKKSS